MKKILRFIVTLALIISVFCSSVFAATVGQTLTGPEAGWRRYDDKNSNLIYSQSWFDDSQTGTYYSSFKYTSTVGASVRFKFKGTKIRLITRVASTRSSGVKVTIDGFGEFHSQYSSTPASQVLVYEKTNLDDSVHSVTIEHVQSGKECSLDAIDINESGYLVSFYQTQDLSVAEVGDSKISLRWDVVEGATNYIIRYGTTSGLSKGDYPYTASPTVVDSVYGKCDLSGLINETTYYFRVGAIVNGVEQTLSNEVSAMPFVPIAIPDSPVNLAAISGDSKVDLSWNASEDAETYNIKRSTTAGGPYTTIAEGTTTTYTDSDVTNGTTYYYVVTAVNIAGESEPSNEASATPFIPVTIPSAPANLAPTAGDSKVDLSWNASEGAATYNIKKSTTAGGPYTTIAEGVITTTYTDSDVTNGTTYYYIVTAANIAGESDPSNEVSAKPAGTPTSSGKIMIKTDDGLIYSGDLVEQTSEIFKLKNVYLYNGIPSFSSSDQPTYNWEISFYKSKVIWFYFSE